MAQLVAGPEHLVGRIISVFGNGSAHYGSLGRVREDRMVVNQAGALLRAGRTALVEVGGDETTCPERLTLLVSLSRSTTRP